jgi:hypothetical protein
MYLLDTNVVSELRRPRPHGGVVAWLKDRPSESLHISAVTLGELQAGVEFTREQDGAKAIEIESWIERIGLTFKVIPMDGIVFRQWARIQHRRSYAIAQDAMIAATAEIHGFVVVTRNVRDFNELGAKTYNPFDYSNG